jgi:hypothetical protein
MGEGFAPTVLKGDFVPVLPFPLPLLPSRSINQYDSLELLL